MMSENEHRTGITRAIIGLVQGVLLYGLFEAFQSKTWPATDGPLFFALSTTAILVPLIVVSALSHLRPRLLVSWILITTLVCASLAWYDIYRQATPLPALPQNWPSQALVFALASGLFIGHSLLTSSAADGRFVARYPTYFDVSWKLGLQAAMAVLFTGVFWLVLWLGAELFKLIKIDFISLLIQKNWFWIPATTLALTCAIHVSDVRVGIIRGLRTLICNLLSWLLPLMTLIAASFIIALVFTGLDPLWNTRRASSILLTAAASLIFLINSVYQDGARVDDGDSGETRPLPRLLHFAVIVAAALLVPIVLLAAYGITLRVGQYGWTPERVFAAACAMISACYAAGYAVAGVRWDRWSALLQTTNVATSFAILAALLALYTPLADPARISVADQLRRLNAGMILPEKLDYRFLRFDSGRFGVEALRKLSEQKDAPVAAASSAEFLQKTTRFDVKHSNAPDRAHNITVAWPRGQSLPPTFLQTDWSDDSALHRGTLLPFCLTTMGAKCDAIFADIDSDGTEEIILVPSSPSNSPAGVFRWSKDHLWSYVGILAGVNCPGVLDALRAGNFELAQPQFKELAISARRLSVIGWSSCTTLP